MKNLTLFFLGLVLISLPACNGKQCFSKSLKPSYPCCKGNKVVYTDKNGDWGVENGDWCGIGNGSCFSLAYGYSCCKGNKVVYTDENGDWGAENGKWCGIGNGSSKESSDTCFSIDLGYPCCTSCKVYYTDKSGKWGVQNKNWCGIKDSCDSANTEIKDPTVTPVKNNTVELDFEFLKMENNKENMVYSPLSIEYALKMLEEGAAGNTLAEINNVAENIKLPKYSNIDKCLSLANGLVIRDSYYETVKTEYINTLKEKYDAEVMKDAFESADKTNQWIEDKTLGIIKKMLKDEMVQNPDLEMLIINALAIDMDWVYRFNIENTHGETFYLDGGEEMMATMMSKKEIRSEEIAYYKDDDLTVLTMSLRNYNGTQFEFVALMPKEDLSSYVEKVSREQINEIDKNLKLSSDEEYGVNIRIPKFKFSYDLKLKEDLMNLGIEDAFDAYAADFSNMSKRALYVSAALHKADIEFTEKGVKAAAVTVFAMTDGAAMPRITYPVDIVINKPFMFLIRDKSTKDIWFTGTVYEPNSWENDKSDYEPDFGEYFEEEPYFEDVKEFKF